MAKFNSKDLKGAFRSLLCRNAIIITLYNIVYQYSTLMKNVSRTFVASKAVGLPASYVTILVSIFSFVGFVFRVPFGTLIDKRRGMLKKALIIANIYRALVYIGFITASSQFGVTLVYILDAVAFCFCGIAGPAVVAISVDKKAMGSAYAIYTGMTSILTGTAKSLTVSLYNDYGRTTCMLVIIAITIVSAIVLCFLDGDALSDSLRKEMEEKQAKGIVEKKKATGFKALLAGFTVAAIPYGICSGCVGVTNQVANTYSNLFGVAAGFDYLGVQTWVTSLAGILTIIVGFLCDFMPSSMFVLIAMIAQVAGAYLFFIAQSSTVFNIAFALVFGFTFALPALRITGMKRLPYSQQGGLSATIQLFMDIMIMLCTLPAGFLVDSFGDYRYAFLANTVAAGIGLAYWIGYMIYESRKKPTPLVQ